MHKALSHFARRLGGLIERPPDPFPFETHARELFELQYHANAAYRRLCRHGGITRDRVADWRELPAAPTVAFRELDLTSLPLEDRTALFLSSGTTGQRPSRHFHNAESLAVYQASLTTWFQQHLLAGAPAVTGEKHDPDQRRFVFLSLTPPPAEAPHSSLVYMLNAVMRQFGAASSRFFGTATGATGEAAGWRLDGAAFPTLCASVTEARKAEQPIILLGTAFNFVHLLEFVDREPQAISLPRGSRVMETGGYKGRSRELPRGELHTLISNALSIPTAQIVTEFGMCELSSQAYAGLRAGSDTPAARQATASAPPHRFRFPPWARALVVSPETGREVLEGETGLLRVIDLANVWSVMAVQTEDLVVRRNDAFELLGRAAAAEPRGCSLMTA